jgi:hypothetical protein
MSVYILDAGDPSLSSQRSIAQVESILVEVNQIWSPAGITLDAINIQRLLLPNDILQELLRGNLNAFLNGIGREFEVPDPAEINLFYARSLGGPNGIAPYGGRALFVADQPTVEHARVTSHEIGHALGLHHDRRDREQLMFSGTNGVNLSAVEISTARYIAAGILAGVR